MEQVTLVRNESDSNGTFGTLTCPSGLSFVTLEPIEPIPEGSYQVIWTDTPIHGMIYELQNVPGHTGILIHVGNIVANTLGCILLGEVITVFMPGAFPNIDVPIKGINNSVATVEAFEALMATEPFTLTIC